MQVLNLDLYKHLFASGSTFDLFVKCLRENVQKEGAVAIYIDQQLLCSAISNEEVEKALVKYLADGGRGRQGGAPLPPPGV